MDLSVTVAPWMCMCAGCVRRLNKTLPIPTDHHREVPVIVSKANQCCKASRRRVHYLILLAILLAVFLRYGNRIS